MPEELRVGLVERPVGIPVEAVPGELHDASILRERLGREPTALLSEELREDLGDVGFANRAVRLRAICSSNHANRLDVPAVEPPHLAAQPHRHLPGLDLEDGATPSARPRVGPARG